MTDYHDIPPDAPDSERVWKRLVARGPELYAEYAAKPTAAHSPDLQFILQKFRKTPCAGKYVLVALEPHRRWCLATLTAERGRPVIRDDATVFTDLAAAERHVFRLRWRELTGVELSDD